MVIRRIATTDLWNPCGTRDLPEVQREFAEVWRATDKVAYSSTLDAVPEPRTRLERRFDPEVVQTMKDDTATCPSVAPPSTPRPCGQVWSTGMY